VLGLGIARAFVLVGLDAQPVRVEVTTSRGPSFFQMVGLAEAAVRESRVRVASALAIIGVLLDEYAITVNLAPGDLRKSGAGLDLAIAVALLAALGRADPQRCQAMQLCGELSLEGLLLPMRGMLPLLEGAKRQGIQEAIVPTHNSAEAGLVRDMRVFVAKSLTETLSHINGEAQLPLAPATWPVTQALASGGDLSEVRGQASARRTLEIAAAGNHNVLFVGPPGGGKTLLARRLPSIMPTLAYAEAIEVTAIHSVAGLVDPRTGVVTQRPFRAPHHSISEAALVGGGDVPRPGEISLAHHGVLFLDELAEFRRNALEALRQPLEDGKVCISRTRASVWFPARPLVVAAVNSCPCGYYGHPTRPCSCSEQRRLRYAQRLSGPLLDRFDMHCAVPPVEMGLLSGTCVTESSGEVRERVAAARAFQSQFQLTMLGYTRTNAELTLNELERLSPLDGESRRLLHTAGQQLGLSARAYVRIVRVARTIADLQLSSSIVIEHVAEATQARLIDRQHATPT
jgi:magnesium chelatase family protein